LKLYRRLSYGSTETHGQSGQTPECKRGHNESEVGFDRIYKKDDPT
jgi:hypothetical protein